MGLVGRVFVVLVIVGAFVAIVYGMGERARHVVQPIEFNHAMHVGEASLTCIECHTEAETRHYAGLPGKDMCLDCHDIDEEQGSHPEKDRMFTYREREDDFGWVRVAVTRPDVFFSHRRHVTGAKMDCLECHPDQPTLNRPPAYARLVMTMNDCIACHESKGASSDCLVCHR